MFHKKYLARWILKGTLYSISSLKIGHVTNGISRWPSYESTRPSFKWPYHWSTLPEKIANPNTLCGPNRYKMHCKTSSNPFKCNFCIKRMRNRAKSIEASAPPKLMSGGAGWTLCKAVAVYMLCRVTTSSHSRHWHWRWKKGRQIDWFAPSPCWCCSAYTAVWASCCGKAYMMWVVTLLFCFYSPIISSSEFLTWLCKKKN